jgi:hypothetical protein
MRIASVNRIAIAGIVLAAVLPARSTASGAWVTYTWRVQDWLHRDISEPRTVKAANAQDEIYFPAMPEINAKVAYTLSISVSADGLKVRSSPPCFGEGGSVERCREEVDYANGFLMTLVFDTSGKYGEKGSSKPAQLYVCRTSGPPGTVKSPFLDGDDMYPELFAFLAGVDFRRLHGGGYTAGHGSNEYVQLIDGKAIAAGRGRDVGFYRRNVATVDARSRLLSLVEWDGNGICFVRTTAQKWVRILGVDVPEVVTSEFGRGVQRSKRVFSLVGVSHSPLPDMDIPKGLTVLDYRKLGANISAPVVRREQPSIYRWSGRLPPY